MLVLTIWPVFALIVLGFVLMRAGFPERGFWPAAERVNYFLFFPVLLISSLSQAPVRDPELLALGGAATVTVLLASLALYLLRRMRPAPPARFGPVVQGVIRFNTYLGLAIVGSLAGSTGLERAAVYLAIAVPVVNVLSILALTGRGETPGLGAFLRPILRNPLIIGCVVGFLIALSGIGLPFGIDAFLGLVAQASLPLGLLCVGAALRPSTLGRDWGPLVATSALRLVAMPVLAAGIGALFGLGSEAVLVLVVFSSIPTAAAAYVLTRQMGGDGELMAGIVTAETLVSVLTIPLMLALLLP